MTKNGFKYNYSDNYSSDITDSKYTVVSVFQGYNVYNQPIYADYNQVTTQEVIYSGTRSFSYSVPRQFLNNIKISAGIVFKF